MGSGEETSISHLAHMIAQVVGFQGEIINDLSKPDGYSRKFLDTTAILATGWRPQISLHEGLKVAYNDFLGALNDGTARVG